MCVCVNEAKVKQKNETKQTKQINKHKRLPRIYGLRATAGFIIAGHE